MTTETTEKKIRELVILSLKKDHAEKLNTILNGFLSANPETLEVEVIKKINNRIEKALKRIEERTQVTQ